MNRVFVITGTPGVGKTFLARALAGRLRVPFVDLGEFIVSKGLYSSVDRYRGSVVGDDTRVRQELAKALIDGGVVATHFLSQIFPERAGRAIVLRLDPIVLWRRLRARGWSRRKAWENVESELLDVCYFDAVEAFSKTRVFELDTTGKSRRQVLNEALRLVGGKAESRVRPVDWLGVYDPIELGRRLGHG